MARITKIIEQTVSLSSGMSNAGISFDTMTASAVVMVSDVMRGGKPLVGLAFDSIGRYSHGALLHERFIPRIMNAAPESYCVESGTGIDPFKLWTVMMANEKAGGHGERAGAVGLLDSAAWDLQSKIEQKPLWALLNERFPGARQPSRTPVYASGGHYRPGVGPEGLAAEIVGYRQQGYTRFKIKTGGLNIPEDQQRIEAAIRVLGNNASALSVDFNACLSEHNALQWLEAMQPYGLAWLEEPVDPLDYQLLAQLAKHSQTPLSTGENLFSIADTRNLLRHGGLRPQHDFLNIDISLSYGIVEYTRILDLLNRSGWKPSACIPHAGHLLSAHVAAGLGLGGHETAPAHSVLGPYPQDYRLVEGHLQLSDRPGTGLEAMPGLQRVFQEMLP